MSDPTFPIHPSNNNNNSHMNGEDYTMNNPIAPNYTKISEMPGINDLIFRLEEDGITFGDRLLRNDNDKENLIVLGSFFNRYPICFEYNENGNTIAEYNYVDVALLVAIDEKAVMWTNFAYVLDSNGNFDNNYPFETMCSAIIWNDHKHISTVREEFAKASCGMSVNHELLDSIANYSDYSTRYTIIKWIKSLFQYIEMLQRIYGD